jgi:hypothetical protein
VLLQIGGIEAGDGNLIAGNNGDGIRVTSASGAIVIAAIWWALMLRALCPYRTGAAAFMFHSRLVC